MLGPYRLLNLLQQVMSHVTSLSLSNSTQKNSNTPTLEPTSQNDMERQGLFQKFRVQQSEFKHARISLHPLLLLTHFLHPELCTAFYFFNLLLNWSFFSWFSRFVLILSSSRKHLKKKFLKEAMGLL